MAPTSETPFDASPEQALFAMATHEGPVLVDLDETLYLRNSTEDFVGSAWPAPLAYLLMKILDKLRPWRMTGGGATRDVWRVAVISTLLPWSLLIWRLVARRLAREASNVVLIDRLKATRQPKAIVTLGFLPIVSPLVAAMGLHDTRLVAMRPWRFRGRREGKLALVINSIGEAELRSALLVTDSTEDLDLLEICSRPLRVLWPEARYHDAFTDSYIPGQYLSRVKRPGTQYIYHNIIKRDLALWILASVALASNPIAHVAGLAFLLFSFWTIYESGYVDNDRIGEKYEKDPVLSKAFFESPVRTSEVQPWLWAAASATVALFLLRWPDAPAALDFLAWTGVLLVTFFGFRLYNRIDKRTRIWLYPGLQALRTSALVALVPVTLVGMLAMAAHVIASWLPYYSYRRAGGSWQDGDYLVRLLSFVLLSFMVAGAVGWSAFWSFTALALLLWNVYEVRFELKELFQSAHRIDRG